MKNKLFDLRQKSQNIDYVLLLAVVVLVLFGILMVFSASFFSANHDYGDPFFFAKKQALGAVLGFAAMTLLIFIDYKILVKLQYILPISALVLLGMVFIPGIGIENYGANRWINLGFISFQPSEIAKFAFIVFTAAYMSQKPDRMTTFKGILPVVATGGAICVLIILEPNLSITVCVGLLMLLMLFIGGVKWKWFLLILVPIGAALPLLIIAEPYRLNRLAAFLNPWASPLGEGYQLIQSFYSLGAGGWFGVGLFNSRQKMDFLPFAESDFIFSIIGEELGFVGCVCVLLVFGTIIYRGIKTALNASDRFGCYLASGISGIIAIQTLINIAVVTGSIPPTGLPLPFISAGSSSLIVFLAAVGILLNIGRYSNKRFVT